MILVRGVFCGLGFLGAFFGWFRPLECATGVSFDFLLSTVGLCSPTPEAIRVKCSDRVEPVRHEIFADAALFSEVCFPNARGGCGDAEASDARWPGGRGGPKIHEPRFQ